MAHKKVAPVALKAQIPVQEAAIRGGAHAQLAKVAKASFHWGVGMELTPILGVLFPDAASFAVSMSL